MTTSKQIKSSSIEKAYSLRLNFKNTFLFFTKVKTLFLIFCFLCNSTLKAECDYEQVITASEFQIGIMLTWSTNYEDKNERFIIEKSENGVDFDEVGTVRSARTSDAVNEYNFLHIYPREKKILYRLKEISYEGTISYSDIAIFNLNKIADVRIARLSNIFATDNFEIKLDSYTNEMLSYSLKDLKGNLITENTVALINGLNDININTEDLPVGIYKIDLAINDAKLDILTFKKVLKQGKEKTPVVRKN